MRIQAFEFNELSICPEVLRENIIEILGLTHRMGSHFHAVSPLFYRFCKESSATRILDLCSGTGVPAAMLLDAVKKQNKPVPKMLLTDLFPNTDAMKQSARIHPKELEIISDPVDASRVPKSCSGYPRTIIAAFHHFPPKVAKNIIMDAVRNRSAIFIMEIFPRSFPRFFSHFHHQVLAYLAAPLLANNKRLAKCILSYTTPLVAMVGIWDAMISVMRVYTQEELMDMVRGIDFPYLWKYEEVPFSSFGRAVVFTGIPESI